MITKKQTSFAMLFGTALAMLLAAFGVRAYEPTESDARESYNFSLAIVEKTVFEVSHILVADQKAANEVSGRLAANESWETLAAIYSIDPDSREKGGNLGWHFSRDFVEPFAKAVRSLKPGVVSRPVQTSFGWHLIKVLRTRPFVPPAFESVRARQEEQLKKQIAAIEARAGDKSALNDEITKSARSAPVLRRLIELGADVNATSAAGDSPLHWACQIGLVTEAEVLIKAGAAVETAGRDHQTPFHFAAFSDKTGAIVRMLLLKGVAPAGNEDDRGIAPIHLAAAADNSEAIRLLVKAGEPPNRLSREKMTPLMYAASSQAPRAIAALLDSGADPLLVWTDTRGKAPLKKTALDMILLSTPAGTPAAADGETMLRKAATDEALKRSNNSFKAFITQDDNRIEVGQGPILLKKEPFTITFEVKGSPRVSIIAVDLGGTGRNSNAVLDRLQGQMRSSMRAMAENPKSSRLIVFSADDPEPGFQSWGNTDDRPDFLSYNQTSTGYVATRQIDSLDEMPSWEVSPTSSSSMVTLKLDPAENIKPMLLVLYIPESLGLFEYAVKQRISSELRWLEK